MNRPVNQYSTPLGDFMLGDGNRHVQTSPSYRSYDFARYLEGIKRTLDRSYAQSDNPNDRYVECRHIFDLQRAAEGCFHLPHMGTSACEEGTAKRFIFETLEFLGLETQVDYSQDVVIFMLKEPEVLPKNDPAPILEPFTYFDPERDLP